MVAHVGTPGQTSTLVTALTLFGWIQLVMSSVRDRNCSSVGWQDAKILAFLSLSELTLGKAKYSLLT